MKDMFAHVKIYGRYSEKVTKLETANVSHPFYGTLCTIFIAFELL